ncbi:hypothetical protein D3C72_2136710 [compost metagenome]
MSPRVEASSAAGAASPASTTSGPPCIAAMRNAGAPLSNTRQGFIDISPLKIHVSVTSANSSPLM